MFKDSNGKNTKSDTKSNGKQSKKQDNTKPDKNTKWT